MAFNHPLSPTTSMEASGDLISELFTIPDSSQQQALYTSNSHASDDLSNYSLADFAHPTSQQPWYNDNQGAALTQPCSTHNPAVPNTNQSQSDHAYVVAAEGQHDNCVHSCIPAEHNTSEELFHHQPDGYIHIGTSTRPCYGRSGQQCSNRPGSTTSTSHSRQTISTHHQQKRPRYSCPPGSSNAAQHSRADDADSGMHQHQHLNNQYQSGAVLAGPSDAPQEQVHRYTDAQGVFWQDQHFAYQIQPDAVPAVRPDATQHGSQWEPDNQGPWQRLLQDDDDFELDADTQFNSADVILQLGVIDGQTQHAERGQEAAQHAEHAGVAAQHDEDPMQDTEMLQQQETAMDFAAGHGVDSLLECVQDILQQSSILKTPTGQIQAPTPECLHELLIKHGLLLSTDSNSAASSSSSRDRGPGKSEKELLSESLNDAIKQLLLALGLNKIATGNWDAIIKSGGTTDTGVTGLLCETDAKRPPFVIATLLRNLLEFRDSLLNTFIGASIDIVPPGLSEDMIQERQRQYNVLMEVAQHRQRLQNTFETTLRKPQTVLHLFQQLYLTAPYLTPASLQGKKLCMYTGYAPHQMTANFTNYRRNDRKLWLRDRQAVIQTVEELRQGNQQAQANTQAQDTMLDNNQVRDMETDEEIGASAMHVNAAASSSQVPDVPSQAADIQANATATLFVTRGHCRGPF